MENNDIFKFRIWDTVEHRMRYDFFVDGETGKMVWFDDDGDLAEVDSNRYRRMQCTGLKDRSGILIYDGDLLEPGDSFRHDVETLTVEHRGMAFVYYNESNGYEGTMTNPRCFEFDGKVIGNIYENQ